MEPIKYYTKGALGLLKASISTVTNGKPNDDVVNLRKYICQNCPLFDNGYCSRNKVSDGNLTVSLPMVEKLGLPKIYDKDNIITGVLYQGKVLTIGCGCNVTVKSTFYFSEDQLNSTTTNPCPLHKWKTQNLIAEAEKLSQS